MYFIHRAVDVAAATTTPAAAPAPVAALFDPAVVPEVMLKLSKADAKLQADILKANAPQIQETFRLTNLMGDSVTPPLPWYARKLQAWSKNAAYDKVRLGRDVTLSGVAIWALYQGGKIAFTWVKSLF